MLLSQVLCRYSWVLFALMILSSVMLLQGCGGGGDDSTTYGIGGTVSGLTGTVVLQNNGGSDLTISQNGDFTFGTSFTNGTSYAVTVLSNPNGQGCAVSNASGSVRGSTISNIIVTCTFHQDASGIYTGSAELNTIPTKAMPTDLKGMIYNNKFYIFSIDQKVLYAGTISQISGNNITATTDVYVDGAIQNTAASVTGTVTTKSQMTLNINGTGKGNGQIQLTYQAIYERGATQARILAESGTEWFGTAYAKANENARFYFEATYVVAGNTYLPGTCFYDVGTYSIPTSGVNIFPISNGEVQDNSGCLYIGVGFDGMATVVDNGGNDNEVWVVFANGTYSLFSVASR